MQPGTKLATGLIAVCLVLGVAAIIGLAIAVGGRSVQPAAAPAPVPVAATTATGSDPYPECAAVREWLRDHAGEPDGLQVLEWERRYVYPDNPSQIVLRARYRASNQYGAKQVETASFTLRNGKVQSVERHRH